MLDSSLEESARDGLAGDVQSRLEGDGTLKQSENWGVRKLAYEIKRQNEADYRWFRFEAPTELLNEVDHHLKITDGVLRFRIFRVEETTPVMAPPAAAAAPPAAAAARE